MSGPVAIVEQGWLRGARVKNVVGGSYISFKGIPFAAPPVGNLRFADPQPPQPWTGVRDSSREGSKCAQLDPITNSILGDDDCLYLNVATTSLTGSRPVMVWIHGGAFVLGDGGFGLYSPDYMMGSGVVYVGINYRVGVLGFLHLDHEVAPGNIGLKDQVAALKWVKENIAQFGGDPNNVTIFGESAGGASVHYLLISPLAKDYLREMPEQEPDDEGVVEYLDEALLEEPDVVEPNEPPASSSSSSQAIDTGLFHKAIIQSGVVLNPFATVSETVDIARRYVATLGNDVTDPNQIVEYLRTIPVHRLIEVQENMLTPEEKNNLLSPFGPSVDDKSVEPFMPRPYEELITDGFDIPVIIGYNSHEGIMFVRELKDEAYTKLDENFAIALPRDLVAKAPSKAAEIAGELRKFYFGERRITKDLVDEYVQYYGDVQFVVGIHKVVEIQRGRKSPTYFYRFSYDSPNSLAKKFYKLQIKGTMHSEDIRYLFFASAFGDQFKIESGSTDELVRDRFVRMWTDFAKTGNPTPSIDDLITEKWEPVTRTTKNYLEINAELSAGVNPNEDMWDTWKRIYAMVNDQ